MREFISKSCYRILYRKSDLTKTSLTIIFQTRPVSSFLQLYVSEIMKSLSYKREILELLGSSFPRALVCDKGQNIYLPRGILEYLICFQLSKIKVIGRTEREDFGLSLCVLVLGAGIQSCYAFTAKNNLKNLPADSLSINNFEMANFIVQDLNNECKIN